MLFIYKFVNIFKINIHKENIRSIQLFGSKVFNFCSKTIQFSSDLLLFLKFDLNRLNR